MSNYREELAKLTDEELLKKYKYVCERYEWWSTSDDGSEGAFWDYEGQPVVEELKKRGINYHYELERMKIYDYLDKEIKSHEYKLSTYHNMAWKGIEKDKSREKEMIKMLETIKKDLEVLEILLASFLKKSIGEGTQPNTTILLDSESYDRIKELLDNDK